MQKVAVIVSHPIQHFCPQYSSWAKLPDVELHVFFASKHGLIPYEDKNFGRTIQWSNLSLTFPHSFLSEAENKKVNNNIDAHDLDSNLLEFSPDALIIYGYIQKLQRRARQWANSNNIPIIMIADSELRTHRNIIKSFVKKIILPRIYRQIKLFLTVGDANEAYYRNYGVKDSQLVRCFFPINCDQFNTVLLHKEVARARIRNELGIPDSHNVILNVGKFVSWKRQKDLVELSNQLQQYRNDVTIILAGTGHDEENLKKACHSLGAGGVIFAGFVQPEILTEYYCSADVYVHCAEHEPHSLAISEAIYCALPVVISDRCGSYGPSDDVKHGLNGLVYQCGNIDDLSKRLLYLFNNNDEYHSMSGFSKRNSLYHQALAHGDALKQALRILASDIY